MNEHEPDPRPLAEARRQIRRFTEGVLRIAGDVMPASFVIDGQDGSVVFPCDHDEAAGPGGVLYIPHDGFDEMAILLDAEPFEARFDEVKDRHQAYHGSVGCLAWYRARVDSAKWKGKVYEGESLLGPNPLRGEEASLVRTLNADRDRLAEVTRLLTGVRPEQALCVGVDPIGMDVRTRVGVIRVEWPREIESSEQAPGLVGALLADGLGS